MSNKSEAIKTNNAVDKVDRNHPSVVPPTPPDMNLNLLGKSDSDPDELLLCDGRSPLDWALVAVAPGAPWFRFFFTRRGA